MSSQILNNLGSWKEKEKGVLASPFSTETFQKNMEKEKARSDMQIKIA